MIGRRFYEWQNAALRKRINVLQKEIAKLEMVSLQLENYAVSLRTKLADRGQWLRYLERNLHDKNVALDALHYVWCDGGCSGGTHRWSEEDITKELVETAERNTRRLRTWFENKEYKKRYSQKEQTPPDDGVAQESE